MHTHLVPNYCKINPIYDFRYHIPLQETPILVNIKSDSPILCAIISIYSNLPMSHNYITFKQPTNMSRGSSAW